MRDAAPDGAPCWIDLFTSDLDGARTFYGELFGWKSSEEGEDLGHYVNFTKDDARSRARCRTTVPAAPLTCGPSISRSRTSPGRRRSRSKAAGRSSCEPMPIADLGQMAVLSDAGGAAIGVWQPGTFNGFGVLGETNAPSWFELHTRDFAPTVAFYEKVFGWDIYSQGDSDEFRYSTLGEGDGQLAGVMDAKASFRTAFPPTGRSTSAPTTRMRRSPGPSSSGPGAHGARGHAVRTTRDVRGHDRCDVPAAGLTRPCSAASHERPRRRCPARDHAGPTAR